RQAKAANRSRSAPPTTAPSSSALESVLEAAPEPSADAPSEPAPAEHQGARPRTSRVVSDAPVLWREFRQASFGSRRNLIILLIALAIGLFFLYRNAAIDDHAVHLIIGVVTLLMIGLHSAVVPSGAIAGERDARTLEALLTTLLTPAEIIRGKLLGILRRQWLAFAILAAHFSYATIAGITRPITIAHVLLIAAYTSVFLHSTCMFWSLLFKRATTAAAANVLLALSLWMGAPILTALLMEAFGYYGPPNDVFTNGVFTLNPMVMLVSSIEGGMSTPSYGGQSGSYSLPGYSVGLWGFNARVAVNGALYVGAALLALLATRRLFTRLARR
ncbi:MAG: hypothetical protein H7Y88_04280, partial [Phycisphaerales bacterium]|nr:hypothetical protein [Phycisphaerales bacterium]